MRVSMTVIWLPVFAGTLMLYACDHVRDVVQAVAPPTTLTGTFVEQEHGKKVRARWKETAADPGDLTEVLKFNSDQTVARTFLHRPTVGTYTLEGNLVRVTINSKDPETHQWQTYARAFKRERDQLLDEEGNLLVRTPDTVLQ